ncbi:MAG: 16S rRNA (cytidine(1402)-2'-O)-methyltransferase [Spirochaetales bacterium]|nr:16S rRNA (cytidine(1402)-2'-O)-methyltransferase [Spirochaetales bacterium]
MATLFVVATPIGNLDDITRRALAVLEKADYVACEDTRQTLKLLSHYGLKKRLVSHYSYNERASADGIVKLLAEGRDVALVTDSGTPGISDPGTYVVRLAREKGFAVSPVPGASALSALLSVSGFSAKGVSFQGFLSPKKGRRKNQLQKLLESGDGFLLYESPMRITGLLADLAALAPDRRVVAGRELTKIHEEILAGIAQEVLTELEKKPKILGEFSLLVAGEKNVKELGPE